MQSAPAASSSDCLSGYSCWFQNGGYTGWIRRYHDVQYTYIGASYTNQMSSWINRNSRDAAWYPGAGADPGTTHCMPSGVAVSQVLSGENDTMSSFRIYSDGASCTP